MLMLNVILLLCTCIVLCACEQSVSFHSNAVCTNAFSLDGGFMFETATRSASACVLLCTETAGCGGVLFYKGNGTCIGVNAGSPMFESCALPGAKYYKRAGVMPGCVTSIAISATVAPSQLTSSSDYHSYGFDASRGRLGSPYCWKPIISTESEYIQVEFDSIAVVTAVTTKGFDGYNEWVTSYRVYISTNCVIFEALRDDAGNPKVFSGNTDAWSLVTNDVTPAVHARCVRINPATWHIRISLKFELQGCFTV